MLLILLSLSAKDVQLHRLSVLLLDDGLQFLLLQVLLVPESIRLLILTLNKDNILIFLPDGLVQSFLFVLVVNN